jgi:UBX domain-containing protein 7
MTSWHLEEALQLFYIDGESALTAAHPVAPPPTSAAASALAAAAGAEEAMRYAARGFEFWVFSGSLS